MTDLLDTIGLDYDSARDATPRWFGVSFGNGNNGVSQMFPDYCVRTIDPWELARKALIHSFLPEWQERAAEATEVDGEADYTVYAVIYNPLDDDEPDEYGEDWASANGAWLICEVFPMDLPFENPRNVPLYESIDEAF